MIRLRSLASLLLAGSLIAGCGGSSASPRAPAGPVAPAPALHQGPLTDFVPAAGLRWMVVAQPADLARSPALKDALALLLPRDRLQAFAKHSGVDLREVEAGLVAGFDYSTLYAFQLDSSGSEVQRQFSERLVSGPRVVSPHPKIRRVTGVVGRTPESLVIIDKQLAAVSVGSTTPARIVELYALGKLKKSPPALKGAALSALPDDAGAAPLSFYAPGPFSGEWARGARGLLANAVAVAVAIRPLPEKRLQATITLAGEWPEPGATTRLVDAWDELSSSNFGRLLGLDQPAAAPIVSATPDQLRMTVELSVMPLAQGLRAAVLAEVWEITGPSGSESGVVEGSEKAPRRAQIAGDPPGNALIFGPLDSD